jgi:hypothetical protein
MKRVTAVKPASPLIFNSALQNTITQAEEHQAGLKNEMGHISFWLMLMT